MGILLLLLILGCIEAAQSNPEGGNLAVSIISPANGGGAPGQTLQAGVFAITNNSTFTQKVESVTISFSRPSLFSSAILKPPAVNQPVSQNISGNPLAPVTVSPPGASVTFSFSTPVSIAPGAQPVFALEVKMSPISRNESDDVRYASFFPESRAFQLAAPLWIALSLLGFMTGALSDQSARRAWLIAGLLMLLCIGAPGCGGDSGGPSSQQMVTLVTFATYQVDIVERNPISTVTGLPLNLGIIFGG